MEGFNLIKDYFHDPSLTIAEHLVKVTIFKNYCDFSDVLLLFYLLQVNEWAFETAITLC